MLGWVWNRLRWAIKHQVTYWRLQRRASKLNGARSITTTIGRRVWMTPIEAKLYGALIAGGLVPYPQHCVRGFFLDIAFPDVKLGIEADGAAYHQGEAAERDQWRDRILQQHGWTIVRYTGADIHRKPGSCAEEIQRQVEERRMVKAVERRAGLVRMAVVAGTGFTLIAAAEFVVKLVR